MVNRASLVRHIKINHLNFFPVLSREAACNQSQLFPFIHDKIFVWIQKKESQGCHTAGNLSTFGFLLYDSALCLDPHMESSLTDFVYRALYKKLCFRFSFTTNETVPVDSDKLDKPFSITTSCLESVSTLLVV